MKKLIAYLKANIDSRDVHAYLGAALLSLGGYFIYPPLVFIAPGAIFLYIAFRR